MSQPASKEPTMDEILSSIRQIIADDDEPAARKVASAAPAKPAPAKAVPAAAKPEPAPISEPEAKAETTAPKPVAVIDPFSDDDDEVQPLALSPEQIIADDDEAEEGPAGFDIPEAEMPSPASLEAANEVAQGNDLAFDESELKNDVMPVAAKPESEKPSSFAHAAPMPDATLSADMANELLEPATKAAVHSAFAKLGTPSKQTSDMALGASGLTIENMIREMLRPMLKDWLEENLPSMVERMVEKEIERVSRGG
ncbi:DUF2497 domain-containing protein [Pelagibacterium lentulum]|nr:DUF2497 domain-containing protein [Pelagibacterium lentulum]